MKRRKWNPDDALCTLDQTFTALDILGMVPSYVPLIGQFKTDFLTNTKRLNQPKVK